MNRSIDDFLTSISRASNPAECLSALFELTSSIGLPRTLFLLGERRLEDGEPVLDQTRFWNYAGGPDFDAYYVEQGYHRLDPLIPHVLYSSAPVYWNDPQLQRRITPPQRYIFDEAREFGFLDGYTLPVHYEQERFPGALTVVHDRDNDPGFVALLQREGPTLHLATYLVHAVLLNRFGQQLIPAEEDSATAPCITLRERECLKWAAAGLVSKEIAGKMHISERTVNLHFAEAMRRLNARTRTQAVAKALAMDLLDL